MHMTFEALPTDEVRALRAGKPDAYGRAAERGVSGGAGYPCRHCLDLIPAGRPMLILAHRPFPGPQPYAETGPIFLCADACTRHRTGRPKLLEESPDFLVKAYGADDRIVSGTGRITPSEDIERYAGALLEDRRVAYVHVRSARNNCYMFRIGRAHHAL